MKPSTVFFACLAFALAASAQGLQIPPGVSQIKGTIVSADYQVTVPLKLTPGQVVTLTVAGMGESIDSRISAAGGPWPTTLAGVSAIFYHRNGQVIAAPIVQIDPYVTCTVSFPSVIQSGQRCGKRLAVTLQVPFNLEFYAFSGLASDVSSGQAVLILRDGDGMGGAMEIELDPDAVRVLRGCELALNGPLRAGSNVNGCTNVFGQAFRADGTRSRAGNLIGEGETITLYAYGLGPTRPLAESGRPPAEAVPQTSVRLNYSMGANLPPGDAQIEPEFVGLSPGGVGLYQINFKVPRLLPDLPGCSLRVNWNFAVRVTRFSTDWVGICVDPSSRAPD